MAERFGVFEVANLTFFDLITNKPVLYLDTLKMTNFESTADVKYATGGEGAGRILAWDSNKTAQLTIQNALLDPTALAMQTGNPLQTGVAVPIYKREVLTFDNAGVLTLTKQAIAGTITVYSTTNGRSHDDEITDANAAGGGGVASATEYTVSTSGGVTKLTTDAINAGHKAIVYYQFMSQNTASVITLDATNFPGYYRVIGDTVIRNERTGQDEPFQVFIPKAKLMPEFSLELNPSGDPTVFDFNLELFKDGNSKLLQFIHYPEA